MDRTDLRNHYRPPFTVVLDHGQRPPLGELLDGVKALTIESVKANDAYLEFCAEFGHHFPRNALDVQQLKNSILGDYISGEGLIHILLRALDSVPEGVERERDHDEIYTFHYLGVGKSEYYMALAELKALGLYLGARPSAPLSFLNLLPAQEREYAEWAISYKAIKTNGRGGKELEREVSRFKALACIYGRESDREKFGLKRNLLSFSDFVALDRSDFEFVLRGFSAELLAIALMKDPDLAHEEAIKDKLLPVSFKPVEEHLERWRSRIEKYPHTDKGQDKEARLRFRAYATYWSLH
jgi:hypothetical protein